MILQISDLDGNIWTLQDATSIIVTQERNGIFELEFTYPSNGANFDKIAIDATVDSYVDEKKTDRHEFRIVSIVQKLPDQCTVIAQHWSYLLSGIVVDTIPTESRIPQVAIQAIMDAALGEVKTTVGAASSNKYLSFGTDKPMTLREALDAFIDVYGGVLTMSNTAGVVWRDDTSTSVSSNKVIYGVNLTSYAKTIDYSEFYNRVFAYWKKTQKVDGEDVETWVKSDVCAISQFGKDVKTVVLDLSSQFAEQPGKDALNDRAVSYAKEKGYSTPEISMTISAVNLSQAVEYQGNFAEPICLNDKILVKVPLFNENEAVQVTKTVYDALNDRLTSFDVGTLKRGIADTIAKIERSESKW